MGSSTTNAFSLFSFLKQWSSIVNTEEENRQNFKVLSGKNLYSVVALCELKAVLKANTPAGQSKKLKSAATQEDGFKEVRRRKQRSTDETAPISKISVPTTVSAAADTPPEEVLTRNFFAPLRTCHMDTDSANTKFSTSEATAPAKTGRPPPITLSYAVNLIQFQKHLEGLVSENFEFCSTRNGTGVITRNMADFQIVKSHFDSHNLSCY
jgi:hypothetical protein